MHEHSPHGATCAVGIRGLVGMDVWSAWSDVQLAGGAAIKAIDDCNVEIQSMRVSDEFLGLGIGRALLRHLLAEAHRRGVGTAWLATGRGKAFDPARRLYRSEGLAECDRFGDYADNDFSVLMSKHVNAPAAVRSADGL